MTKGSGFKSPHQKMAEHWHMSVANLEKAGCRLLSPAETKKAAGFDTASVEWVYRDLQGKPIGISRWRLYDPSVTPEGRRYTNRTGDPVSLYLPPGIDWQKIARDPSKRIYISEGEAKALYTVARHKRPCISIQGCSGWQSQGVPAEQFSWFKWKGRTVIAVPDSDHRRPTQSGADIRRGFAKLAVFLKEQGAKVRIKQLTDLRETFNEEQPEKSKAGMDDWLHYRGWDAFTELPSLSTKEPEFQAWLADSAALPEALRSLKPIGADWFDTPPPPAVYVVPPYLLEGELAVFSSPGGTGKSFFLLALGVSAATGRPFYTYPIEKKRRVMYLMLERNARSFHERYYKVTHHYAEKLAAGELAQFRADLHANFQPYPLAGQELKLIEFKGNQWVPSSQIDGLIAKLKELEIELLILDPLSRLHGANENDAAPMSAVTRALERIMQAVGCTIAFIHHVGKTSNGDGQYAARGSSAIVDNTSEAINLSVIEATDKAARESLYLSALREDEHKCDIVRVVHARCSDGPRAADMYLLRAGNGVLVDRRIRRKSGDNLLEEHLPAICEWARARGEPFTYSEFTKTKRNNWGGAIGRPTAEKLFDSAVAAGVLRKTGEQRNGGDLYSIADEMPSGRGAQVASCPLPKKRAGHSKRRGAQND